MWILGLKGLRLSAQEATLDIATTDNTFKQVRTSLMTNST